MSLLEFLLILRIAFAADERYSTPLGGTVLENNLKFDAEEPCVDEELFNDCSEICGLDYQSCLSNCDSQTCQNRCLNDLTVCISFCPCGAFCPDGCSNCENDICDCKNAETDNFSYINCREEALIKHTTCFRNCPPNSDCLKECNEILIEEMNKCSCMEESDETCTDPELGEVCTSICADETSNCLSKCSPGNASCEEICIREGFTCVDACPCNLSCPGGCKDLPAYVCSDCYPKEDNEDRIKCREFFRDVYNECYGNCLNEPYPSICIDNCAEQYSMNVKNCPCDAGCPDGCPCPNYECDESLY